MVLKDSTQGDRKSFHDGKWFDKSPLLCIQAWFLLSIDKGTQ